MWRCPILILSANAPVSYGVFALSRPDRVPLPGGEELLDLVQGAGYEGVDLGPHGLLGTGTALVENLERHGLRLCGGWLDFPFAGSDRDFDAALTQARAVLDDFATVASRQDGPAPLPTIADSGSEERRRHPGGGPGLSLDRERWDTFARRVERVAGEVRDLGLEPTFHHHAVTHVETPVEIDRLLEDTTIDLTLDTGHLVLGGGDPLEALERWHDRVNHVHLKDVDREVMVAGRGSDDPVRDIWEKRVFVALGEGDVDVPGFMDRLVESGYDGWVVVEQDVVLMDVADVRRAVEDQRRNRDRLRRWVP